MDIYVKPKKKAEIIGRDVIRVADVADVFAPAGLKTRVDAIRLKRGLSDGAYAVSVLDVVAAICAALPGHTVVNVGEMDTLAIVKSKPSRHIALWTWTKVAMVAAVLFVGSATAIMAFHTDSQLGTVFQKYYEIFFGHKVEKPYIITIPYSIGLALGIIVFFNHFTGKRITKEPTPIEIEMELYQQDAEDALLAQLEREKP